jgi:hypothetical protein
VLRAHAQGIALACAVGHRNFQMLFDRPGHQSSSCSGALCPWACPSGSKPC